MSYYLARSYSIDFRRMRVNAELAVNNVRPLNFSKAIIEYGEKVDEMYVVKRRLMSKPEAFLSLVINEITSGNIKLYRSVYFKYRYAFGNALKEVARLFNGTEAGDATSAFYNGLWLLRTGTEEETEEDRRKIIELINKYNEVANAFYNSFRKELNKGKYVIEINDSGRTTYFNKMLKYGYRQSWSKEHAKIFDSYEEAEVDKMSLYRNGSTFNVVQLTDK